MREIKFRVWHKGKMITEIIGSQNGVITGVDSSDILMQFTGMYDKNSKEIYEGDILKDGSTKYPYLREVYWDDRFQWSLRLVNHNNQFSSSLSNDKYIVPEEMRQEVVGNIYENPELLS